jgi:hypothetical protein
MQTTRGGFWAVFLLCLLARQHSLAATNDLLITSITKQDDCVTLQWKSHPGEYYTVFWTDRLELPIFWRVAEVNVPSGGTNTVWTEGECSQSMMAGPGAGGGGFASSSAFGRTRGGKRVGIRRARLPLPTGASQSAQVQEHGQVRGGRR